jgi:hypothetical protein
MACIYTAIMSEGNSDTDGCINLCKVYCASDSSLHHSNSQLYANDQDKTNHLLAIFSTYPRSSPKDPRTLSWVIRIQKE